MINKDFHSLDPSLLPSHKGEKAESTLALRWGRHAYKLSHNSHHSLAYCVWQESAQMDRRKERDSMSDGDRRSLQPAGTKFASGAWLHVSTVDVEECCVWLTDRLHGRSGCGRR